MLQKYGIMQGEKLILSENCQDGYKPVVFEELPETFDELTQYAVRGTMIDKGDYIWVGVEIGEVEVKGEDGDE